MTPGWHALTERLRLPPSDRHDLPTSPSRFADGGQYRVEIPSVEGPAALAAVFAAGRDLGVPIHRISQGSGIGLLRDEEVTEMVRLGSEERVEVCLFVGPRAPWEGTAAALVPDGRVIGWRHTGMDQLSYAFGDVERAVALGIRSVLLADEGLIWLVGQARASGQLPSDLVVKASALLGLANPVGIRLVAEAGLGSVNISSETTLARLGAMRQVLVDLPLDLYVEGPDGLGGFVRHHEVGEIVRIGAPVYLKFGLRNAPNIYPSGVHLEPVAIATARERVRRAAIGLEHLQRALPEAVISPPGSADLGVPVGDRSP
ncbi:hypothetical protein BH23CHL8_BH23CHL8_21680 [soil metagenome]